MNALTWEALFMEELAYFACTNMLPYNIHICSSLSCFIKISAKLKSLAKLKMKRCQFGFWGELKLRRVMFWLFTISSWRIIVGKCISKHSFLPDLPSVHTNSSLIWKRQKKGHIISLLYSFCIKQATFIQDIFSLSLSHKYPPRYTHANISIERGWKNNYSFSLRHS